MDYLRIILSILALFTIIFLIIYCIVSFKTKDSVTQISEAKLSVISKDAKCIIISFNFNVKFDLANEFCKLLEEETGLKVIPLPYGVTAVSQIKP